LAGRPEPPSWVLTDMRRGYEIRPRAIKFTVDAPEK
jgi:hypothetical protein